MDDIDRLNCDDVTCALGGHYACNDLPPPLDPPDSVEVSEG